MGLEIVELIMRVEEDFAIEITDAEAELISTPGTLCDLVERKVGTERKRSDSPYICPTSRAFYAVRRELMNLGVERNRIKPQTPLKTLWGRSERRQNWEALRQALNYGLPPLHRSPEWAFIGLLPLGTLPIWFLYSPEAGLAVGTLYVCAWYLGTRLTQPFATHIREEMLSVGALCHRLAPRFTQQNSDLWPQIQAIIVDEFGVPIETVTRNAHFYRDLGLG